MILPGRQKREIKKSNPCTSCGACCALYRVTFPRKNVKTEHISTVPVELTIKVDRKQRGMKGTYDSSPRCAALRGEIGCSVSCSIYNTRPAPCRIFRVSWEDGRENEKCARAREFWGMKPLKKRDFI
jgi:Fe-S-cluster containining protein